tara:strand:+ start:457 stop:753 length:297 start_codon:yes stop_codon:yes gene_type:complete
VQIAPHAPAVLKERVIGADSGQDYASVTTGMVESTVTNAMTVTSLNQTEYCRHATFVEQDTQVKTAKPAQRDMLVKIVLFATRGGNLGQMLPFYFLMY